MPGPGKSLVGATEVHAVHVRRAVSVIEKALRGTTFTADFNVMLGTRAECGDRMPTSEAMTLRAAWALVSMWLVGRLVGGLEATASIHAAEGWFLGGSSLEHSIARHIDQASATRAAQCLAHLHPTPALAALLPYVLDSHGPGSRASVMRDPTTHVARQAKRSGGVFYTPADVADYMVRAALAEHGGDPTGLRCLDSACGSGVFLRAMLHAVEARSPQGTFTRLGYATSCLFGMDVSAVAVECACFVLLHDCWSSRGSCDLRPWQVWHLLRLNLNVVDSVTVLPPTGSDARAVDARSAIRQQLVRGEFGRPAEQALPVGSGGWWLSGESWGEPIDRIFPEAAGGFDIIVGNPPYAPIGYREDAARLAQEYASLSSGLATGSDLYPLFLEMTWRLAKRGNSAACMVVPLSIAYHTGKQFVACRRAMSQMGGRWRFAFFDREPHALFGEDVKTRNAIVLRREVGAETATDRRALIETGPLRKWTSRTRASLFASISFTPLPNVPITNGIPKVEGSRQAITVAILSHRRDSLAEFWLEARKCDPEEAFGKPDQPTVFLASTAYNFLNVYREHQTRHRRQLPLTENPLLAMRFGNETKARAVFAILSSRLTFWWWHTHGDGFHVPRRFVETIPVGVNIFSPSELEDLAAAGDNLWRALQPYQIVSVNGGRETVAYRPLACDTERDRIDHIVLRCLGLNAGFLDELKSFVRAVVVVDESDARRKHVRAHFSTEDDDV